MDGSHRKALRFFFLKDLSRWGFLSCKLSHNIEPDFMTSGKLFAQKSSQNFFQFFRIDVEFFSKETIFNDEQIVFTLLNDDYGSIAFISP